MEYLLGIDMGTTSVKVGLFQADGQLKAISTQEYVLLTSSPDKVELPVDVYWSACKAAIAEILKCPGVNPEAIVALSISSQGETLILTDRKGRALRNAIVWLDHRAGTEASEIGKAFQTDEFYHVTGLPEVVPYWPIAKIMWIKRNEIEVFHKTFKFLLLKDYLIYKLTGEFVTEPTISSSTGFLRLKEGDWWDEMVEFVGVSRKNLPELVESETSLGKISPEAALQLGLSPNTVVVAGAMDQMAGAVGAGNIAPGVITETTGTALALIATVDFPLYDPQRRIPCSSHAVAHKFVLMPYSETAGIVLKWFRDTFGVMDKNKREDYSALMELAKTVPPGSEGLLALPHFAGTFCPDFNPEARGAFVGMSFNHKKGHFVRALLESITFMLKENVNLLKGLGIRIEKIRSLGGAAKSDFWLQIKSDVLNLPIDLPECSEAACLGAAILAGIGAGVYRNMNEAVKITAKIKKRFTPRPENVPLYEKIYQNYLNLYRKLYGNKKLVNPSRAEKIGI